MLITLSPLRTAPRRGFTLVELLIAITILAMLSALSMAMVRNVAEYSRIDRTKTMIKRLDTVIMERYNSYLTRTVPIRLPPPTAMQPALSPQQMAWMRLMAIRELMRMEMPNCINDLATPPQPMNVGTTTYTLQPPALYTAMRRKATTNWLNKATPEQSANESAECLYLILSTMHNDGRSPIDAFSAAEIGDTDNDGMHEILDAWGQPIVFLRWAPGFTTQAGMVTTQTTDATAAPDPFDPMRVDPGWGASSTVKPFALKPLIYSGGQDRKTDINGTMTVSLPAGYGPTYPYYSDGTPATMFPGTPTDTDGDGSVSSDNLTNHYVETP